MAGDKTQNNKTQASLDKRTNRDNGKNYQRSHPKIHRYQNISEAIKNIEISKDFKRPGITTRK